MFNRNTIRRFNNIFANFDTLFREIEDQTGCRSFPHVDIPGIFEETQFYSYSEGDRTVHYKNGALHREDGPAVVYHGHDDNTRPDEYWLEGKRVTKEEMEAYRLEKVKKKLHKVSLSGETFTITGEKLNELKVWLKANSVQPKEDKK